MSFASRDTSQGTPKAEMPVAGVTGAATEIKSLLTELAGEIEDSRRRQSHALLQIERKLHAIEAGKTAQTSGEIHPRAHEAWDAESADALAGIYDHGSDESFGYGHAHAGDDGRSWLHSRFVDISQHLARSLSDMRPQSAVHALGERIEQFHSRVHDALDDVARRSDVEGLRLIEAHVTELGLKLTDMQAQLSRLDNIEADLRTVMDEVSGERLVRLNEHQDVLADVIDTTARRTAEQFHAHMAEANAISTIDGGRFEELRGLIENAIIEQRQAEASASSVVSRIGSTAKAQSDHLSDLKALVESSIDERRKGEQDAMAMLDTVQQALMQVLDRIEQLEEQQHAPGQAAPAASAFAEIPITPAPATDAKPMSSAWTTPLAPSATAERPPAWDIPSLPIAPPQPSQAATDADDADLSPVERMRRDFIADAQRAKLKAASSWTDGAKDETTKDRRPMAVDLGEAASNSVAALRSRLFGVSPKLLAAALGLIVAINGGILLMSRKMSAPPVAVETMKEPTAHLPADSSHSSTASDAEKAAPEQYGERAATKQDGRLESHDDFGAPGDDVISAPTDQTASSDAGGAPYQTASETSADDAGPASAPRGTTVDTPQVAVTDETLAALYQQQVLAGLSSNLGNVAARAAQDSAAPNQTGSIETAYTPPEIPLPAASSEDGTRSSKLDLPPATVGPLSLRLAAAAGDASAEFEVAARLAEGKGTNQNFKEAIRWYQRSAAQGFAQAQYRIGTLYERGLGVQKDLGRARVWYQRAAEQGNVKAMHNLAVLSAGGEGGGPDYAGATSWFIKAAEHGLPDSQYNLAVLFENGLGVPQDSKTAYKWYALAARAGDKDAVERRDALKATLSPADLKAAEALASNFTPKPADPLANDARAAGEDWKKRANSDGNG